MKKDKSKSKSKSKSKDKKSSKSQEKAHGGFKDGCESAMLYICGHPG